jgi:hypothetical protein
VGVPAVGARSRGTAKSINILSLIYSFPDQRLTDTSREVGSLKLMMGVLAIDTIGAGLDGVFTAACDFYNRRMGLPDVLKAMPATWDTRPTQVDPVLGMHI